jgi:hypothetical protein
MEMDVTERERLEHRELPLDEDSGRTFEIVADVTRPAMTGTGGPLPVNENCWTASVTSCPRTPAVA